jgi:hypothetical protein
MTYLEIGSSGTTVGNHSCAWTTYTNTLHKDI